MIWSTELPEILIRRQFTHLDLKIISYEDYKNYTLDTCIGRVPSRINLVGLIYRIYIEHWVFFVGLREWKIWKKEKEEKFWQNKV